MSLYYINTEELIIKPANSHKLWVNYWVKKADLKLKKISRIIVQSVRKYFRIGNNRFVQYPEMSFISKWLYIFVLKNRNKRNLSLLLHLISAPFCSVSQSRVPTLMQR